jgi:hypothetical protein
MPLLLVSLFDYSRTLNCLLSSRAPSFWREVDALSGRPSPLPTLSEIEGEGTRFTILRLAMAHSLKRPHDFRLVIPTAARNEILL